MLHELSIDAFEAVRGQTLRITSGEDFRDLELADVSVLNNPSPRPQPPFSLTFRDNGAKQSFGQGVYRLLHPTLGPVDLFFVPLGPDGKGMTYEVTFN